MADARSFYEAIINAGTILTGFCGTFLAFRISREASYYRQPALDFETERAKDIEIHLAHFTSPLLLLVLASLCSAIFGFVFPLLALAGWSWALARPSFVAGGLVSSLVLVIAYFADELVHYEVLRRPLIHDAREWGREKLVVAAGIVLALGTGTGVCLTFS